MGLIRFGISLDKNLLMQFDALCSENKYENRSEAIRDLIREALVKKEWAKRKGKVACVISMLYDHHKRELVDKLMDIQHDYQDMIISTQHAHLSHDNCIEVVVMKGDSKSAKDLAMKLRSAKGVKHADFIMTTTGKEMK